MALFTHWAPLPMHMPTWCLPKLAMLWTYYADLLISRNILYSTIIILVTMNFSGSLNKELTIIILASTFWTPCA